MACAWLCELDEAVEGAGSTEEAPAIPAGLEGRIDAADWSAVARLARTGLASPLTTSAGRLFDAVSALCGLRLETTYEGQAAIELEMAAAAAGPDATKHPYPLPARHEPDRPVVLDARELIRAARADLEDGVAPGRVARRFHLGLADGTAAVCIVEAARRGLESVVLSGGVFQNVLLLERLASRLTDAGLEALVPRRLPPNDGGISFGQVAVALARAAAGSADENLTPNPR
jgi:hydrogenase maturation protein HypF